MHRSVINRFFFAVLPPPSLACRIAQRMASLDAQLLAATRLHLTMFILDDRSEVDQALIARLIGVGDAVRFAPIAVVLERLVASQRSIALRPAMANGGLVALHADLARLARSAGIAERHGYRFGAHMTLGYRDGVPSSRRIAPVGWTADELVLIHSHVGRTRHEVLGRWPLDGAFDPQLPLL